MSIATPTLARAPAPTEDAAAEQSRWRRLARVTLLHQRAALAGFSVLGLAVAIATVVEDHLASGSYATYVAAGCVAHPMAVACGQDASSLAVQPVQGLSIALRLLPLLTGVFLGGPLIAREIEAGTFRFAWTQATRRTRLVAGEITVLGLLLVALAVGLGLGFGGWYAHIFHVVVDPVESPWQPAFFFTTWFILGTWTAFALVLGAFVGALVKRTVAAMAASAVVLAGLLVAAFECLPRMLAIGASVTTRLPAGALVVGAINRPQQFGDPVPAGSWLVRAWLTDSRGHVLDTMQNQQVSYEYASTGHDGPVAPWLARHHLHAFVTYQPPSHYWAVQGAEGLALLGLTVVLAFATVRAVRGRTTHRDGRVGGATR